jgi:outer membrane protein assembly factor BamE (lipoprotein component of BamABCDE complex)
LRREDWYYDRSTVSISLPDRRVTAWDNKGNLKVHLSPKTAGSAVPGYFTRGSSQDDVLHVQGSPTKIMTYSALRREDWYYDRSTVSISLPDRRVTAWDNKGNLKVHLSPKTAGSAVPGYFTRGSSQDDVLHVQGSPTKIMTYSALRREDWYYGRSTVTFSLPDGRVTEWNNNGNNLKVS